MITKPRKRKPPEPPKWPREVKVGSAVVTVYRTEIGGKTRHQLRWFEAGEVKRQTITDEEKALDIAATMAKRLDDGEHATLVLSALEAEEYRQWKGICGDVTVSAALNEWARARRILGETPITDAAAYYVARHQGVDATVSVVIEKYLQSLSTSGLSESYTAPLRGRLTKFSKAFFGKSIRSVTEQEIRAYVAAGGGEPRTQKNVRDAIVGVWRWARKQGYLPRDIQTEAERVEAPKIRRKESIEIFAPEEIAKILAAASTKVRAAMAICAFSGVRSHGEISRLEWDHFRWDQGIIDMPPGITKTGERRLIPILPNLLTWLKGCSDRSGFVMGVKTPDYAYRRAAKLAGVEWRHNGLRHSYGSYRVAQTKSIDQTSLEMGNSPAMVKKHYLEAVHEGEAAKWFSVVP
ncbi:MAG TPA: site-specific integrase [Chthoniobacteraceae bacterium]|nr:site-specific integrase [Chthoniobacteraceae bacterium]